MKQKQSNKYWFRRVRKSVGYFPVTLQGRLCVAVIVIAMVAGAVAVRLTHQSLLTFASVIVAGLVLHFVVGRAKGPSLRWRWDYDTKRDF